MTIQTARKILDRAKAGLWVRERQVTIALIVCGDLPPETKLRRVANYSKVFA